MGTAAMIESMLEARATGCQKLGSPRPQMQATRRVVKPRTVLTAMSCCISCNLCGSGFGMSTAEHHPDLGAEGRRPEQREDDDQGG